MLFSFHQFTQLPGTHPDKTKPTQGTVLLVTQGIMQNSGLQSVQNILKLRTSSQLPQHLEDTLQDEPSNTDLLSQILLIFQIFLVPNLHIFHINPHSLSLLATLSSPVVTSVTKLVLSFQLLPSFLFPSVLSLNPAAISNLSEKSSHSSLSLPAKHVFPLHFASLLQQKHFT